MPDGSPPPGPVPRILHCDDPGVLEAVAALRAGGVVAYPTETQYGLGTSALDADAVARLQDLKGRQADPFLVVIDAADRLERIATAGAPLARHLVRSVWPGPVTLVLPARAGLPAGIVGREGGVAVRVPAHEVPRRMVRLLEDPIVSTSANLRGEEPLTDPQAIAGMFASGLAVVLDVGVMPPALPSTVVAAEELPLRLLREGAVSANALARRTGLPTEGGRPVPLVLAVCTGNTCRSPMAEGILRHLLRGQGRAEQVDVASAGVAAVSWGKAVEEAQQACWKDGVDISAHRPRQLTEDLIAEADLLIAMSERHRNWIVTRDPSARERTHILAGLSAELKGRPPGGYRQISDPYGGSERKYRQTLRRIWKELEAALDGILERAGERRARETERLRGEAEQEGVQG